MWGWAVSGDSGVVAVGAGEQGGRAAAVAAEVHLARFVASGAHDRHLRKARATYRVKRDLVLERLGQVAELKGIAAGLHVVAELPAGSDEAAVVRALAERDVVLEGLRTYCIHAQPPPALVLSYSVLPEPRLRDALDIVAEVLG